jgi:hypothetical protein
MKSRTNGADSDQMTPEDDEMVPQDRQDAGTQDDELAPVSGRVTGPDEDGVTAADDQVVHGDDGESSSDEDLVVLTHDDDLGPSDDLGPADDRVLAEDRAPADDLSGAGEPVASDDLAGKDYQMPPGDDQILVRDDDELVPDDQAVLTPDDLPAVPQDDQPTPVTANGSATPDLAEPAAQVVPATQAGPAGGPAAGDRTSPSVRWHEIQAMFVDDPRTSVELAAGLVDDSTDTLVASLRERQQALQSSWQGNDTDTEGLRTALQSYRAFSNRLEEFSSES